MVQLVAAEAAAGEDVVAEAAAAVVEVVIKDHEQFDSTKECFRSGRIIESGRSHRESGLIRTGTQARRRQSKTQFWNSPASPEDSGVGYLAAVLDVRPQFRDQGGT